jgi:surface protein
VKHVTAMNQLFFNKASFNSDISNWNVSAVTNMQQMFSGASSFNSNISNWNVEHVTDMLGIVLCSIKL